MKDENNKVYTIAFIYASPTPHLRRKLWHTLEPGQLGGQRSWIAMGDFNSVSSAEEVSNPETYDLHRNANFNHWIFQEGLIDMGFNGGRFTWMRGKESDTFKGARLDRALGSSEWMDMFPDTSVTHLPMFGSDHAPIRVTTDTERDHHRRRFFFQATWPSHKSFGKVVSNNWNEGDSIMSNARHMADVLAKWNKNTFGNIHARKRKLLARIGGIQKAMANNCHNGLVHLNNKLQAELEEVLNQEELLWFQQSRENWIKSGDRNTKFYHLSTKVRQKRRRGYILKDTNGQVAKDYEESGSFLQEYFRNIFSGQETVGGTQNLEGAFPDIENAHWAELDCPVS